MANEGGAIPDWLVAGQEVVHSTFGTGTVGRVGEYENEPTVWIDFHYGERKALSLQYGLPHLGRLRRWSRKTPPNQALRCDVCGSRPLVLNTHGQMFCEEHRDRFCA